MKARVCFVNFDFYVIFPFSHSFQIWSQVLMHLSESVSGHLNQEAYQVSMVQFVPKTRLPKLSLLKFNGEITKFRTFWDSFQSAVDNNPNLTPIDKFNYLYSLLEGPTDENYKSAVEILHNRFGKTQQVIAAHMPQVVEIALLQWRHSIKSEINLRLSQCKY
jgi:hypothetical protein